MKNLANKYRPKTLDDLITQPHLITILKKMLDQKHLMSFILYGNPGTGKSTIAKIIAHESNLRYHFFNATTGNKKDLDVIFNELNFFDKLLIIIDEIHRLNKDKQDLLLPHIENGNLILIGTTTSNPLFAINPAIRSRVHLFEVKVVEEQALSEKLAHIAYKEFPNHRFEEQVFQSIAHHVQGDVRYALNIMELLTTQDTNITTQLLSTYQFIPNMSIDKNGDGHYDLISAFQKSIRGSDVNAALYYLAALILANDFDSIYRRLSICAYEDVGLANPNLISRVANCLEVVKSVGLNEGRILLAEIVVELCLSPKSKSAYHAIDKAIETLKIHGLQIPEYLKLHPSIIDEEAKYDYQNPNSWRYIQYLPDKLRHLEFYIPGDNQYENLLKSNYQKLQSHRTSNLKSLRSRNE